MPEHLLHTGDTNINMEKKKAMSIAKLPLCVAFRPEEFYLLINLGLHIFTMYRYGSHLPKAIDYLEVK